MSKPMRVEIKYVQGHFYIINFRIYLLYQAVIPIFDIWIGFGVMAEKLNHYVGIFRFLFIQSPPKKIQNSKKAII